MFTRIGACFIIVLMYIPVEAQRDLLLVGSFGLDFQAAQYRFLQNGSVLRSGYKSCDPQVQGGVSLGLQYNHNNRYALEYGCHFETFSVGIRDSHYQSVNNITGIKDDRLPIEGTASDRGSSYTAGHYNGGYLAAYYFLPHGLYVRGAVVYNHCAGWNDSFSSSWSSTSGETLRTDFHLTRNYINPSLEFGYTERNDRGNSVSFFLNYAVTPRVMRADYSDTQNGLTVATDQASGTATTLGFGFKFGYNLTARRYSADPGTLVPMTYRIRKPTKPGRKIILNNRKKRLTEDYDDSRKRKGGRSLY